MRRYIVWLTIMLAIVVRVQALQAQTTVQYQTAAAADDGNCTSTTTTPSATTMLFPATSSATKSFLRWSIDIPEGAIITSASMKVMMGDNTAATARLSLIDSDDCPNLTAANPYSAATVVGASVDVPLPSGMSGQLLVLNADLASLIQEFIDRPGYAPGNYMGLIGEPVGTAMSRIYQCRYDGQPNNAAILEVTYETVEQFTVQYPVASAFDDTFCTGSSNYVTNGTMSFPDNSGNVESFFRWSMDIPNGATIVSATLKVKAGMTRTVDTGMQLALVDSDNCPAFNQNPFGTSTVTGTEVNWSMPYFTQDQWYTSVDVSGIVQSYVNRPGYLAGNYMGLAGLWDSGYYRKVYQHTGAAPGNAAILEITYSGGNYPPVAEAGSNQEIPDTGFDGSELVTLDGSGSSDSDGTIVSYVWSEGGSPIATGATPQVWLTAGMHVITLTVTDNDGGSCTDTVQVFVHSMLYVDFEGGDDANSGMSPGAAWKHCPGDPSATDVPAGFNLIGGDKIIFKGGVVYRGRINCTWSGSEGRPIIYDGNTAGTWGTGKAVFDGSETISGWTQCQSAQLLHLGRLANPELVEEVGQTLQHFTDTQHESCMLVILVNGERAVVCFVDCKQAVRLSHPTVEKRTFFEKPTGRMLAAIASEPELEQILERQGLPGPLWNDIKNEATLRNELEKLRRQGYAYSRVTQPDEGYVTFACPVSAPGEKPWGVVGTHVPAYRCPVSREKELLDALLELAVRVAEIVPTLAMNSAPQADAR